MIEKLSQKDKRILKLGGICAAVILLYFLVLSPWFASWAGTIRALQSQREKFADICVKKGPVAAKRAGLLSVVPVVEMPKAEKEQGPLFRGRFNEQLKKAGIKVKSLQMTSKQASGRKILRLQCRGKCNWGQAMDLLADLNSNPCFVAVEEIQLKCNPKNPQEIDLMLTVSTFAKSM